MMQTKLIELKENLILKPQKDVQYVVTSPNLFGSPQKIMLQLEKSDVTVELVVVYKLTHGQKLNITTETVHKVPRTTCITKIRGVLFDNGISDYTGKIIIEKMAQQTSAYLDDRVLVVGQNTQNNSRPILKIDADDVKASHGAVTGRISRDQLYYLQSRGLSLKEAEELIVKGFFEDILNCINDAKLRKELEKNLV